MTEERLITGINVTSGGEADGQQLPALIEKAEKNGIKVTEVIGDMAYVSEENLDICGDKIELIAQTNTAVAVAADASLVEGFSYNKDAGMLQCPVGELVMRVEKQSAKNGNQYHRYLFSKKKCKKCLLKDKCRVGKGKSQAYSITQVSEENRARLEFEASERFQERMKLRYGIEEKMAN